MKYSLRLFVVLLFALLPFNTFAAGQSPSDNESCYTYTQYFVKHDNKTNPIALIKFSPDDGWKWNNKYPSKFKILKPENGTVPYIIIDRWTEKRNVNQTWVWLELKPSKVALIRRQNFTISASYSFCDKHTCRIFKKNFRF
jgi:hypothetical protein